MWDKIIAGHRPNFQNEEDARIQLQAKIRSRENPQTLVVLDDVWSKLDLEKLLLFEGKEYKALVTTRDESIMTQYKQYPLPFMKEEDALSLFCSCAFGQSTIPSTHDEGLVKQVQAGCGGLPLALKVIGTSLRGQPLAAWKSAKEKLPRGQAIDDYHRDALFGRLKTSIDVLEDEAKQCFLTLGAFPEGRNICANALLDIWVYVRGMEWRDAFVRLLEFSARTLLVFKGDPWSLAISYDCPYDISFSQHEVMRGLALHLEMQDKMMLWTPQVHQDLLSKTQTDGNQQCRAHQIVSIQTGVTDLSEMEFPEAEALLLIFTASKYPIPSFLSTMRKLKVLIIHNYGSRRFELKGSEAFPTLSQLKALQLEKLIVPSLLESCKALENLKKLSLILCEGLGNMNGQGWFQCFTSPKLSEINLDRCSDLKELPTEICNLEVLQKLSVTNCHLLCKLPDDLGKLSSLQMLRLCGCANLKALPRSICKLGQLEFLDISCCSSLERFPDEFDELRCLKELDMRECSSLRHNFNTLGKLSSLKHVLCDSNNKQPLMSALADTSMAKQVRVEIVDKPKSLEWLNDR